MASFQKIEVIIKVASKECYLNLDLAFPFETDKFKARTLYINMSANVSRPAICIRKYVYVHG